MWVYLLDDQRGTCFSVLRLLFRGWLEFLMEKLQWWSDRGWVGKHLHPRAKENKGPLLSLLFSIYKALHLLLPLFCKHKACGFVALLPKCHGASCAWWGFKTTGLHSALASQGQLSLSNSSRYYLLGLLVSFLLAPSSGLGIWVLWLYHPEELAWVVQEHILVLILQDKFFKVKYLLLLMNRVATHYQAPRI